MPNFAFRFPLPEHGQMDLPIPQIVDLHQIHHRNSHALHGSLHLVDTVLPAVGPDFRGGKQFVFVASIFQQVADNRFGIAIHGGRVDEGAPPVKKGLQNRLQP